MNSLLAQKFAIDISRHAVEISELVFDSLFGAFQNDAVDRFVRELVSVATATIREEHIQRAPHTFVLFSGAIDIRAEPGEEGRESFDSDVLSWLLAAQWWRPLRAGVEKAAVA